MITLLILYYINIVRKGKEKISFPHLLAGFNMYLDRLDQLIPACFHITKPYMGRKRGSI